MRCPYLNDATPEACSAAPENLEPDASPRDSQCRTDMHRYCWLYLERFYPSRVSGLPGRAALPPPFEVPGRFALAPNHLWLDMREDGVCRIGLDAFLAHVLAPFDIVLPAADGRVQTPEVLLRVDGCEFRLVFPNAIHVDETNAAVAARPALVAESPHGDGWLVRGRDPEIAAGYPRPVADAGLIRGGEAAQWMRQEIDRFTRFVRDQGGEADLAGARLANDGGSLVAGVAHRLASADLRRLHEIFLAAGRPWCA